MAELLPWQRAQARQIKVGTGEDAEWIDRADPYYWQAGQTRFTPEEAQAMFRDTQDLWQTQMRDNPSLANPYPAHLLDPNTQWNDPRVTPWFGVDPQTGVYQGMQQQPYATDPNFGLKNALLTTGLAFGGIGGALGGIPGIPGIPGLNPAASAGLGHMPATEVAAALSGMGGGAAGTAAAGAAQPSLFDAFSQSMQASQSGPGLGSLGQVASAGDLSGLGLGTQAGTFSESFLPTLTAESAAAAGSPISGLSGLAQGAGLGSLPGLGPDLSFLGDTFSNSFLPTLSTGAGLSGFPSIPGIPGAPSQQSPAPYENKDVSRGMSWEDILKGGPGAAGAGIMKSIFGTDVNPGWLDLIGKGLGGYFGYQSAKDASDRASQLDQRIFDMAERDRQDRLPYIQQSQGWLQDPQSLATGPWGQEIARQTARAIGGARQENLFDNPTGQSLVMQSLLPQALNAVTQVGNLGLRNTAPLGDIFSSGLNAAQAQGAPSAVLGSTLGDIFNTGATGVQSQNDILRQILGTGNRLA